MPLYGLLDTTVPDFRKRLKSVIFLGLFLRLLYFLCNAQCLTDVLLYVFFYIPVPSFRI